MLPDAFLDCLTTQVGEWAPGLVVTTSPARSEPGWDGVVRHFQGVRSPSGVAVSVPPELLDRARELITSEESVTSGLRELGLVRDAVTPWTMRWTTDAGAIADLPPLGTWMSPASPALPEWVRPFPGEVLSALEDDGTFLGVVAIKPCSPRAVEIAVGTEEAARGKGVARRLVAEASRVMLHRGLAVLYVHAVDNDASARVADAVGLLDTGWARLAADADEPS